MDNNERCIICGDEFTGDDIKIYCPECGAPMHKDCYELEGGCPNKEAHLKYAEADKQQSESAPVKRERHFPDGDGCEICGRPFAEDDERVYCPDCGAPMHRLCYNMTHHCPYESEHTPRPTVIGRTSVAAVKPLCDKCGKELDNGEEKVYCPVCGTPVHKSCWELDPVCPNEDKHESGYDWDEEHKPKAKPVAEPENNTASAFPFPDMQFESFSDMIMEKPLRTPDGEEELTCNGVKQAELIHFLGMNNLSTPRFFSVFMNMANRGKVISVNLSAWFFMPFYHFYRRMMGPAVILTLMSFILTIPTFIAQLMSFSENGGGQADQSMLLIAQITSYVMFFVRIILLLFNDYFYMRWSVSKILTMREQYKDASTDEYYAALEHKGNPRLMYVLIGLGFLMALVYMLNIFMSASGLI